MAEYTYDNILINPSKEGIESLIGKEVYFHNNPSLCLENANEKSTSNLGILVEISKNSIVPFRIEQKCGTCAHTCAHACIIEKKEEPKKYVPFENGQEFFNSYLSVESRLEKEDYFLSKHGIWLKDKTSKAYYMVTKIWDIGDDSDEISWKELLEYYTFLDDSPCGKEVEESNA